MNTAYFEPPLLKYVEFNEPLLLDCGKTLNKYTIAYESYGELNEKKDNVVLILHSFTSNTHTTRAYPGDSKPGWWEMLVGPGRAIDTRKYFVICSNILGGCNGSTGPSSINPEDGKPYGMRFPSVTVKDIVIAQKRLLDVLDIKKLYAVAGGSMGGMQALQWAVTFPTLVDRVIACATSARWSPNAIAMNAIGRNAIMADPNWKNGDYYDSEPPIAGMKIARIAAECTFYTWESWDKMFDKRHQIERAIGFGTDKPLQIERFLDKHVEGFSYKFDANSYILLSRALDQFDVMLGFPSLQTALSKFTGKFLLTSNLTDGLCPTYKVEEIYNAIRENDGDCDFYKYRNDSGHDSFLTDPLELSERIYNILNS